MLKKGFLYIAKTKNVPPDTPFWAVIVIFQELHFVWPFGKKASVDWRHSQEVISKSVTNVASPTVINIHKLYKIDNVPHPTLQIVP